LVFELNGGLITEPPGYLIELGFLGMNRGFYLIDLPPLLGRVLLVVFRAVCFVLAILI
jgi:hypothetical protein